ncbi:MAG: response regulator [Alphaproteobacteria bacterium]|nr:response regulator [Alphaproteobacteria bacterium]
MSLRTRLLLLVVLAVLPAVCIEVYGEIKLRSARQSEIRQDATRLMRLVAAEQGRIGEGARQLLIAFSELGAVRDRDWPACDAAAARIRAQVEGYINIGIADREGNILCSARPVPPGTNLRGSTVLGNTLHANSFAVGALGAGRISGRRSISYGLPYRDGEGRTIGAIWATIDLDWLAHHFGDRFSSPNMTLLIADSDGMILVRLPDQERWVGKPVGDAYMSLVTAPAEGVFETAGIDGVNRVIAYSPASTEPKGLYLGVGLATAPIFAQIDAATWRKVELVSLAFILALVAASLGGTAFIRNPIDRLLLATHRWRAGDYRARAALADRKSEIGKLGLAFDEMADVLERREVDRKAAEDALAALNADLEQRVKDEVAQREKAQAALVQSQKLEALGQLTSGVAHDFNNLLAAILGNIELLRPRVVDPGAIKLIDGAERAASRGAKLIEQLLAFSRHHHLETEPFDANALIKGMADLLPRTIGPAVQISHALASEIWPALADPSQVEIALLNLAINARDAMPLGGNLLLETANVPAGDPRLPAELSGDFVMIAVNDSGAGMTEEVKARAFEPFFTTKDLGKGTGLGLSMVYGVAKQSGGIATIESTPGRGTTIAMFLPRARVRAAGASARIAEPHHAATPRGGARILVVDDDRDVREVTAAALHDHELHEAASGRAALDLLASGRAFDLMIVDYAMPGLTGAQVARRARERDPRLPIILVTGYAEASVIADLPEGAQALRKPFRVGELRACVEAALAADSTDINDVPPPERRPALPLGPVQMISK